MVQTGPSFAKMVEVIAGAADLVLKPVNILQEITQQDVLAKLQATNAAIGAAADSAGDHTVIGQLKSWVANTTTGYPVWLPQAPSGDRPVVYADAKNGHYWKNNAISTAAAVLTENLDWSAWNASGISPGFGLQRPPLTNLSPVIAGVDTVIVTGLTVVVQGLIAADPDVGGTAYGAAVADIPGYVNETDTYVSVPAGGVVEAYDNGVHTVLTPVSVLGVSRFVTSFTPTRSAYSYNGSAVEGVDYAAVADRNMLGIVIPNFDSSPNSFVESVAVYALQPEVDLPTLSA